MNHVQALSNTTKPVDTAWVRPIVEAFIMKRREEIEKIQQEPAQQKEISQQRHAAFLAVLPQVQEVLVTAFEQAVPVEANNGQAIQGIARRTNFETRINAQKADAMEATDTLSAVIVDQKLQKEVAEILVSRSFDLLTGDMVNAFKNKQPSPAR
jgi:hypothetical protein